jgi:methionine synthase II (cobalamin-independent)
MSFSLSNAERRNRERRVTHLSILPCYTVGSFLRPKEIHEARAKFFAGDLDAAELRQVEDTAIKTIVKEQEDAGLKGISDGEFRYAICRNVFVLDQ